MNKISGVNEEVHVDEFDTEDEALFGASDNLIEEETDTDLLEELDIYGRRGEKRNKFIFHLKTTKRIGILQVDKTKPSRGKSEAGASILNTDGKVWIGGKISGIPSGLPAQYYHGFIGCLR